MAMVNDDDRPREQTSRIAANTLYGSAVIILLLQSLAFGEAIGGATVHEPGIVAMLLVAVRGL